MREKLSDYYILRRILNTTTAYCTYIWQLKSIIQFVTIMNNNYIKRNGRVPPIFWSLLLKLLVFLGMVAVVILVI